MRGFDGGYWELLQGPRYCDEMVAGCGLRGICYFHLSLFYFAEADIQKKKKWQVLRDSRKQWSS